MSSFSSLMVSFRDLLLAVGMTVETHIRACVVSIRCQRKSSRGDKISCFFFALMDFVRTHVNEYTLRLCVPNQPEKLFFHKTFGPFCFKERNIELAGKAIGLKIFENSTVDDEALFRTIFFTSS